jgi:hypothetical protein
MSAPPPVDRADQRDFIEASQMRLKMGLRRIGALDSRFVTHIDGPEHHHAVGSRHRHRAQQHRMDDAEHGSTGADAHRENENRDDREPRLAPQAANGVEQVAQ